MTDSHSHRASRRPCRHCAGLVNEVAAASPRLAYKRTASGMVELCVGCELPLPSAVSHEIARYLDDNILFAPS
eukprot:351106-Chlamydomonas_euryale.AAC.2